MPFLLQYLLKFSVTLAVLYLFYYVLLRNLTFYRWNRFYLLCYSLLSFVIPFINITPWIRDQSIAENDLINKVYLINKLPAVQAFSFWPYVSALFIAGMLVMLARFVMQFISIQSIRRNATLIKTAHGSLYDVHDHISPFSFARSIFINTRLHSEEELQRIIQHEFVHVKQQHTVDLLIGELLCIVNWYNPFAWLIKKAIRQNLEFIADNSVLQSGVDARHYQYMLLKVTGLPQYSVSNNFNISSLKERIVMINKLKSASVHLLKFMFVLPLLAIMLLAFRNQQQVQKQQAKLLSQKNDGLAADTVPPRPSITLLPPLPPVENGEKAELPPLPPPPVPGKGISSITNNGIRTTIVNSAATVTLKNGKKEVYDLNNPKEKAAYEKKYGKIPPPPPPPAEVNDQEAAMNENERALNENERSLNEIEKAMNEKEKALDEKEKVASEKERLMNKKEKALYDKERATYEKERAAYEKKYRKTPPPPPPAPVQQPTAPEPVATNEPVVKLSFTGKSPVQNDPLFIVDGVILNKADFNNLDPDQMSSIEILKDESATRIYGDKAKYGVVLITSKNNSTAIKEKNKDTDKQQEIKLQIANLSSFKGVFIVNGKEITRNELNGISPSSIQSIAVLKDKSATAMYGEKGKEGVLVITTEHIPIHIKLKPQEN